MRRPALAALLVAVAGGLALVGLALGTSTTRAFTLGVLSTAPSSEIGAGSTACQRPIRVPPGGAFDAVDLEVGNYHRAHGPALNVVVRALEGSAPPRRGVLPAGYPDVNVVGRHVVEVGRVPDGALVEVCVHNQGPGPVALFGGGDAATRPSTGYIDDQPIGFDFDLVFRTDQRSFATLLGDMTRRASLFRPPWLTPGVYYALIAVLLIGVPALVVSAARRLES